MRKKFLLVLKIIFFLISGFISSILIYFIIILMLQGISLSLLLSILLVLIISSICTIGLISKRKQINIISFEEQDLKFIDIDGWEGQAIRIGWDLYFKFLKEDIETDDIRLEIVNRLFGLKERTRDGIYMFQNDSNNEDKIIIYFGETADFRRRMKEHKNKHNCDWVSTIYYFSSAKKNFGGTIRKKLEVKIIQTAKKNENLVVKNMLSNFKEDLNLAERYNVSKIFENIRFILEHFGIKLQK